jgi:leader peptidase (prepilin peptidase)/N-methyltransferase
LPCICRSSNWARWSDNASSLLTRPPALFALLCGLLGLLVGSFLNVVIHRLPTMMEREWRNHCAELRGEKPAATRSALAGQATLALSGLWACDYRAREHSGTELAVPARPLFGVRRRRSRRATRWSRRAAACCVPLPRFISAMAGLQVGAMLLIWCLIALTCIDFDSQLLPDSITCPCSGPACCSICFGTFADLQAAVIGAAAAISRCGPVYWAFKLTTGKEGMGYGDFKLLAALGAWLGWEMLPLTILLSSLLGAVVGIALIVVAKRGRSVPIPFGPTWRRRAAGAVLGKAADARLHGLL